MPKPATDVNVRMLETLSVLNELDYVATHPMFSRDDLYDQRLAYGGFALAGLQKAAEARQKKAVSWRGKLVGCTVLGYSQTESKVALLTGANVKVDETDLINIHAEDVAMSKARRLSIDRIAAFAIVTDPQADDISQRKLATETPCAKCRINLADSSSVDDRTLIFSALPDLSIVQVYNLGGLLAWHDEGDDSGITTFEPGPGAALWDEVAGPAVAQLQCTALSA